MKIKETIVTSQVKNVAKIFAEMFSSIWTKSLISASLAKKTTPVNLTSGIRVAIFLVLN